MWGVPVWLASLHQLGAVLLLAILLTWLRLQWGRAQWQIMGQELPWSLFFCPEYLLHGHSHVALLGWAFLSFVRDGYAPLSIALYTIHMLLAYVLAWIFFHHARTDSNTGSRYFLEGAVFWMVMATAGPWLLAADRSLSSFWMDAAVRYYLHVLFNGWLLFGLAGLSWRYLILPEYRQREWPFWLMMARLLPALLPQLSLEQSILLILAGMAGTPRVVFCKLAVFRK